MLAQTLNSTPELLALIEQHPAGPTLLAESGVGPVDPAQHVIIWSHRGRVRNEAACAALPEAAPLEASSRHTRHRLNCGAPKPHQALRTIALTPLRCHQILRGLRDQNGLRKERLTATSARSLKRELAAASTAGSEQATRPPKTTPATTSEGCQHRSVERGADPLIGPTWQVKSRLE